jgi:hypothetical protein
MSGQRYRRWRSSDDETVPSTVPVKSPEENINPIPLIVAKKLLQNTTISCRIQRTRHIGKPTGKTVLSVAFLEERVGLTQVI